MNKRCEPPRPDVRSKPAVQPESDLPSEKDNGAVADSQPQTARPVAPPRHLPRPTRR